MTTRGGKGVFPRFLGLAFLFVAAVFLAACDPRPTNVVLVTFDTTRADFLGCYGKESARTENLDRLAAEGFLFEEAVASNPVTQASHSTILTGTYPMLHGVRDNTLFHLPEERSTLAEILGRHGYRTGAAVGGFPLVKSFGLDQGFEFYDDDLKAVRQDHRGQPIRPRRPTWYDERPAGQVNDAILPWLRSLGEGEPFFVWLHYWDPHEPHIAPDPYGELFAHDPYQGEIAYADQSLGTLLREIEARGDAERTVIVMTADHGEGRLEHNEMTHAFLAYATTLHVPLIVRAPGLPGGRRIPQRVGTVDIVPTVLDLLGFDIPGDVQGRSLVPLMRGESGGERRQYYSESLSPRLTHGFGELRVLYRGPYKYIYGPRPELYEPALDPGELHDLVAERPEDCRRLEAALADFVARHASPEAAQAVHEVDDETRRRLEALGYLSTSREAPDLTAETLTREGIPPQDRVGDINLEFRLRNQLGAGQFHLARRTAETLVGRSPDHPFFRAKLAAAYLGLGRVEDAARIVDESDKITAANAGDFLEVAWSLFEGGDKARGRRMAARIVEVQETTEGRLVLARMDRRLADEAGFEEEIGRALELEDENPAARLELAEHLIEQEDFEQAEAELVKLLAAYPAHPRAQQLYEELLARTGRAPTVVEDAVATWDGGSVALGEVEEAVADSRTPACRKAHRAPGGGSVEDLVPCYREGAEGLALEALLVEGPGAVEAYLDQNPRLRRVVYLATWLERTQKQIEVDDAEIEAYYEAHRGEYRRKTQRTLSNIFRRHEDPSRPEETLTFLRELKARYEAGETFAALAREYSQSETRLRGGLVGRLGEGRLPERLEKVASALGDGEVSEPIAVRGGAVLLVVRGVVEGADFGLEEVRETVRRQVRAEKVLELRRRRAALVEPPAGALVLAPDELISALDGDSELPVLSIGGQSLDAGEMRQLAGFAAEERAAEGDEETRHRIAQAYDSQREQMLLLVSLLSSSDPADADLRQEAERHLHREAVSAIADEEVQAQMWRLVDADPGLLRRFYEDNRPLYQSPLRFKVRIWTVPFGADPPAQLVRMEELRRALAAGGTDLESARRELGGTVRDLGLRDLRELREEIPEKARDYLLQAEAGGYSVPFQQDDALHLLWVEERREPEPLGYEEVRERVRDDYFSRFERQLYRQAVDERLAAAGFLFHEDTVRRSLAPAPAPAGS